VITDPSARSDLIERTRERLPGLRLLTDELDRESYRRDETAYLHPGLPLAVALPTTTAEVSELVRLAADRLRYFGHWITPVGSPRRYDTRFFIAVAPEGQDVRHDNREAIAHAWVRPREALELCARETINLRLPTIRTLERFAACATTGELMSEVESAREVRAQLPRITRDGRSVLPGEPGYDDAGSVER